MEIVPIHRKQKKIAVDFLTCKIRLQNYLTPVVTMLSLSLVK